MIGSRMLAQTQEGAAQPPVRPELFNLSRIAQLWPLVLLSQLLGMAATAFAAGPDLFFTSHLVVCFALALLVNLALIAARPVLKARKQWISDNLELARWIFFALILVNSGLISHAMFNLFTKLGADGQMLAAAGVGMIVVNVSATSMDRSMLLGTGIGLALGGSLGTGSVFFGFQSLLYLGLVSGMVWFDMQHRRRNARRAVVVSSAQQRALNLLRDFEQAERGWFWETDRSGALCYISPTVVDKLGLQQQDLVGMPLVSLIRKREDDVGNEERTVGFSLSSRSAFNDLQVLAAVGDEERWWSISGRPAFDDFGNFVGFRGSGTDLTEKKRSERQIKQLAHYDTLTGLANRPQIASVLEKSLRNQLNKPQPCALFMMDLDRFKAVNDTLGHPIGDQLLQQVATRLQGIIGEAGIVGRLGGDEFQIVLPGMIDRAKLAKLANGIILSLAKPFQIERNSVRIGSSIGIAIAEGHLAEDTPPSAAALVRNADLALYAAKDAGRGRFEFYVDSMHDQATERKRIEDALRDALANQELSLVYQPVVDVGSERIAGFEALIRWEHPEYGMISPARFIPIAEEANLIVPIGEWIVRSACAAIARMGRDIRVAVNVSPRQFHSENLPNLIVSAISSSGIHPDQLELEITEGVFLEESPGTMAMFQKLKKLGVRMALDDFGTGYSALGYLKKAPFNKIKIDQSFVRGAADPASMNRAIITSIVGLAASLRMDTTAEGVETHDELEMVRELGCSHIQGYIYGPPMSLEQAIELMRTGGGQAKASGFRCSREPRRRTFRSVTLSSGGYEYEAIVRNLSSRGALIEGLWNVPENTQFRLMLTDNLQLGATARWCSENRVGVAFDRSIDIEAVIRNNPASASSGGAIGPATMGGKRAA